MELYYLANIIKIHVKNHDELHRKRINKYLLAIERLFDELLMSCSSIIVRLKLKDELFQFRKYPSIIKDVDNYLVNYRDNLLNSIKTYTEYEWDFANTKVDDVLKARLSSVKGKITPKIYEAEIRKIANQSHNQKALEAFQNRKIKDITLSERVWNISKQAGENIELAVEGVFKEGMSAHELARAIKSNLNNPDKLFRRVRDKHGNLVLSKNAQSYHPGQGVYRSAHKNALRLSVDIINGGYRESEQIRIKANNDVVGQKIHLSPSHKHYDMCDELKGSYPKDFDWSKWHTGCMCFRTMIMKSETEFIKELNAGQNLPPESSENYVGDVPDNFVQWHKDNVDKMKNWIRRPDFIEDNNKFL
ncbi:hypothetical protein HZP61_09955 [Elizabethkingia anophelis]|nr:hypothetical protein [Elizabethkingia anophelis]MCT3706338.1 hypothetical protein [Elizabethkingia anophelis]MCT3713356.1 hypothetical protein [Elizabethkingia anophelis]MCT3716774.1 hypothetical protein [Elizabethkingia anophelis]MCT3730467.1 hypothetical protein [Elizabethkingia anophelis]